MAMMETSFSALYCYSIAVMARLLTNKYLHREIREKGGAYGGGAVGGAPGQMSFYSYRYIVSSLPPLSVTSVSPFFLVPETPTH